MTSEIVSNHVDTSVLDNPIWESLIGHHAHLAEGTDRAKRYLAEVTSFVAASDLGDERTWSDLAALVGPGQDVPLAGFSGGLPDGWTEVMVVEGVQLTGETVFGKPDPEAVVLGENDVPDMLAIVERNEPGPFFPGTYRMGTYLGIRREGRLVAMAGERLHPKGWTEISAVCTDDEVRGEGLATRLVLAVVDGIRQRGETPFLHASAANTNAIRLYEQLGFVLRKTSKFAVVRTPPS